MISPLRFLLPALAAFVAMTSAHAQQQASKLTTSKVALEVPASSMVLPLSATSAAVFPPCGGCPPKSFPVTASTRYYLGGEAVSLAELKAAISGQTDLILTAAYLVRTGELVSVTADLPVPRANPRR